MGTEESDLSVFVVDFGFAYNNVKFSDRVLRIEIAASGGEATSYSSIDDLVRNRKRKREDENNPSVLTVKELHVCSAILAAKSPFFFKLCSNGMLESEQKHMTLKIYAYEEIAVMDVLNFIYKNSLSASTTSALLDVLMVADKYEVASCMQYCIRLILKTPMTLDSAMLLFHHPSSLLMADSVKPLKNAARQFIASHYKNISMVPMEELMALPLLGIQIILASDSVEVQSEDLLYEFVLQWAKSNYPVLEERQKILGSHLAPFIRFPYMTTNRLNNILTSNDFTSSMAKNLVIEALFFKAEPLDKRRVLSHQPASINHRFVERAYKLRPIRIVELESPQHRCIVYVDLKHKECQSIYPSGYILSQTFLLGGLRFSLAAHCCNMDDHPSLTHCFGLFLRTQETGSATLTVPYEFSVRTKPTEEFVKKFRGTYSAKGIFVGCRNLFMMPWDTFMASQCPYFINDVLHLRVDLSICL